MESWNELIFNNNQLSILECKTLFINEVQLVSLRVKQSLTPDFEQMVAKSAVNLIHHCNLIFLIFFVFFFVSWSPVSLVLVLLFALDFCLSYCNKIYCRGASPSRFFKKRWWYRGDPWLRVAWLGWAYAQGLTGGARDKGNEDVGVHYVRDLVALSRNC